MHEHRAWVHANLTRAAASLPPDTLQELHVLMHWHHHAAQAVNMLRRLGVPQEELPDRQVSTLARR